MLIAACLVLLVSPIVRAEDSAPVMLTDGQLTALRANCAGIQSTLTRIQSNDMLTRVSLGREYEAISTRLMAPMNSRIALAKLDSVSITQTTVDFDDQIESFHATYQQYAETMSRILQVQCTEQPVEFYDTLTQLRKYRAEAHASVDRLSELVKQYRTQLDAVRAQSQGQNGSGESA